MNPTYLIALPAILFAGCAAVVPTTAARLAALDPLTADPSAIELVVVLPSGLAISPGGATLELAVTRGDEELRGRFRLEDQYATEALQLSAGATARQFSLADSDAKRMSKLQAEIATWKREGAARGSLGLGLVGCRIGAGPKPDARGSVLIRLKEDGPLLPLISESNLTELLGEEVLIAIKPCQSAE